MPLHGVAAALAGVIGQTLDVQHAVVDVLGDQGLLLHRLGYLVAACGHLQQAFAYLLQDIAGGGLGLDGQGADFVRHHREAATGLARPGRLDGRIEGALLIKSVAGWPFPNPLIPLNSLAGEQAYQALSACSSPSRQPGFRPPGRCSSAGSALAR